MVDDKFVVESITGPEDYDLNAELRTSSPPGNAGWWLWVAGFGMFISSVPVAFLLRSWVVLVGGFCFGLAFFGLNAVIDKLNEVLFEVRRK